MDSGLLRQKITKKRVKIAHQALTKIEYIFKRLNVILAPYKIKKK